MVFCNIHNFLPLPNFPRKQDQYKIMIMISWSQEINVLSWKHD